MKYLNLKSDLSLVLMEDKKYSRKELIILIEKEMLKSNIQIIEFKDIGKSKLKLSIDIDNEILDVIMFLKNITGAGWSDKPKMRRVQVSNLEQISPNDVIHNNGNKFNLIMGYYNFDDNPIVVCWDAYRYLEHNTIRSCYVSVDSLKRGYDKGYYVGVDSAQKLWIFKGEYFKMFYHDYLNYLKEFNRGEN